MSFAQTHSGHDGANAITAQAAKGGANGGATGRIEVTHFVNGMIWIEPGPFDE